MNKQTEQSPLQELIEMMHESVKQYSDNAQQQAIFYAIIEEAKKLLAKERSYHLQVAAEAWDAATEHSKSSYFAGFDTKYPDKTQYLNSIK